MKSAHQRRKCALNLHLDSAADTVSCHRPVEGTTNPPDLRDASCGEAPAPEAWGLLQVLSRSGPLRRKGLRHLGRSLIGNYSAPLPLVQNQTDPSTSKALTREMLVAAGGSRSPRCRRSLIGLWFVPAWSVPWGAPALIPLLLACTVSTPTSQLISWLFNCTVLIPNHQALPLLCGTGGSQSLWIRRGDRGIPGKGSAFFTQAVPNLQKGKLLQSTARREPKRLEGSWAVW